MPAPKRGQALSRRDRWVVTAVLGVFTLAFAALTLLSLMGIGTELGGWFRALGWSSTPAQIEQLDLQRTGPKGGPLTLVVRYRYLVDDTRHEGTRVGWNDSVWVAFGSWRQQRHAELVDAGNAGRPVLAWYDPKDPASSVLDRSLRWGLLLFLLPVGLFSSLIALTATWLIRNLWRRPSAP
jgi:Protein of unknown function (DUF3592)